MAESSNAYSVFTQKAALHGTWYPLQKHVDDTVYHLLDVKDGITITFTGDDAATFYDGPSDQYSDFSWSWLDEYILFTDGDTVYIGTLYDGFLFAAIDDVTYVFAPDFCNTAAYLAAAPRTDVTPDDFSGHWTGIAYDHKGYQVKLEDIRQSWSFDLSGQGAQIHYSDGAADLIFDLTPVLENGALSLMRSDGTLYGTMKLLTDGMIALSIGNYTYYFHR